MINNNTVASPQQEQIKTNLEQAKNLLNTIINQCEQELSRLSKFEHDLNEKAKKLEEREAAVSHKEQSTKQEETVKDLAEREERMFNIERKVSSTSIETKLGRNQDVGKLDNIGGTRNIVKRSEFVKFDPNNCSYKITLESETRAICNNNPYSGRSSVLGTISNSYKVKLISNCDTLMIGFAPKGINVNHDDNYKNCGYYLCCGNGYLYSQNGDSNKSYIDSRINEGSIVECLLDKEKGTISYKVDGRNYRVAYSNIPNNNGNEYLILFPAFDVSGHDCTFELLNE